MIDLSRAMHGREQDAGAVAHRPQPPSDAVEETRLPTQVVDVGLGDLVVGLDEHLLAAECGQGCLHRQENFGELSCIARHVLLLREPEAASFLAKCTGVAELSPPSAPAVT